MILDALNPWHVLSCDPKRPSLVLGPDGPVQMNHAVLHHDIISVQMSPWLVLEFSDKLLPNGCVIDVLGGSAFKVARPWSRFLA